MKAYELAEEAKTAAKEAEAVAAAKQYHAAHLSSKKYRNYINLSPHHMTIISSLTIILWPSSNL